MKLLIFSIFLMGCLNVKSMENEFVYKILTKIQWDQLVEKGQFLGSEHDQRDGFIHLATEEQIDYVVEKYFQDIEVIIIKIDAQELGKNLVYENGFPHLYKIPIEFKFIKHWYFYSK